MLLRKGNTTDGWEHSDRWERLLEFYTFQDNEGYNTEQFFVSRPERSATGIERRFIQKTKNESLEFRYSFWALTKWQPGLEVLMYQIIIENNSYYFSNL